MENITSSDQSISKAKEVLDTYIPESLQWKIVSVLLSLLTSAAVPILLFIAYMNDHNFFSYDFFIDGVFGMKIFFVSTLLLLLVGAIVTWGFPLVLICRIFKSEPVLKKVWTKENKPVLWLWCIVWILVWAMIFALFYQIYSQQSVNYDQVYKIMFGLIVMFILAIYLLTYLYTAKRQVLASLVVLTLTIFAVLMTPQQVSVQVNSGLKAFGMGGDLPVTIELNNSQQSISGKLKLITPKNIYISIEGNENVTASFPLSQINYKVENKK